MLNLLYKTEYKIHLVIHLIKTHKTSKALEILAAIKNQAEANKAQTLDWLGIMKAATVSGNLEAFAQIIKTYSNDYKFRSRDWFGILSAIDGYESSSTNNSYTAIDIFRYCINFKPKTLGFDSFDWCLLLRGLIKNNDFDDMIDFISNDIPKNIVFNSGYWLEILRDINKLQPLRWIEHCIPKDTLLQIQNSQQYQACLIMRKLVQHNNWDNFKNQCLGYTVGNDMKTFANPAIRWENIVYQTYLIQNLDLCLNIMRHCKDNEIQFSYNIWMYFLTKNFSLFCKCVPYGYEQDAMDELLECTVDTVIKYCTGDNERIKLLNDIINFALEEGVRLTPITWKGCLLVIVQDNSLLRKIMLHAPNRQSMHIALADENYIMKHTLELGGLPALFKFALLLKEENFFVSTNLPTKILAEAKVQQYCYYHFKCLSTIINLPTVLSRLVLKFSGFLNYKTVANDYTIVAKPDDVFAEVILNFYQKIVNQKNCDNHITHNETFAKINVCKLLR